MSDISRGNRDQFDFWHSVSKLKSKEICPIFIDWMWSVIQRYVQKVFHNYEKRLGGAFFH